MDHLSLMFTQRDQKLSIAEILQLKNIEYGDTMASPVQEVTYSSVKKFMHNQRPRRDDSEPCFRSIENSDNHDRNIKSMQNKVTLLINENQKLIEINAGLVKEIDVMKQNKINQLQDSQKVQNYQQKLMQLTQANEQLSQRLVEEQQKSSKISENQINCILQENTNLNNIVQQRLSDLENMQQQLREKDNEIELFSEQIRTLNEKCQVLEQQKNVLLQQQNRFNDTLVQQQMKEQQLVQTFYEEQMQCQVCIKNLEENYNLQITELQNNFQREIETQKQYIWQQCQMQANGQSQQLQEQINQIQNEYFAVKEEIQERTKIWNQERERLEQMVKQKQHNNEPNHQDTNYTFRVDNTHTHNEHHTEHDTLRYDVQQRVVTEIPKENQNYLEYVKPPILYSRQYRVPALNTFNGTQQSQQQQQQQQPLSYPRSTSQYLQREEKNNKMLNISINRSIHQSGRTFNKI